MDKLSNLEKPHKIIDDYEREKIETSIKDLKSAANQLQVLIQTADFADKNKIKVKRKNFQDDLRRPNGEFGPEGILHKELEKLKDKFRDEHVNMYDQFTQEQKSDFKVFINKDEKEKENKILEEDNFKKERKHSLTTFLANLSTVEEDLKASNSDEFRKKLNAGFSVLKYNFDHILELNFSKQLKDAKSRMHFLGLIVNDTKDIIVNQSLRESLKEDFEAEFYKIKRDILFEIDGKGQKPDWIN